MKFLGSVVLKLWATILLLVSCVLIILTVLLLSFFEKFHVDDEKNELTQLAVKIVAILEEYEDKELAKSISWELIDQHSRALIIEDVNTYTYSPNFSEHLGGELPISYIMNDPELSKVFSSENNVSKKTYLSTNNDAKDTVDLFVVGAPLQLENGKRGAVFLYQSLHIIEQTTKQTTRFITVAAGIAIVLTTIFAFFLSTRITLPLRKMREVAFEIARGKFDTKVPILTHDEIGELAMAINQMGRQLKYTINALSQEKEQLSSILSSMADGVITLSKNGTILVTNPPAERFLQAWYYEQGMKNNEEELPQEVNDLFRRTVSFEKEQVTEISMQGRDWVILMSPLYNQTLIRGAVAVLRDMTEERRLDKLREDFIANVSHELRTPIAMLQGYSEAIIDDIASTDDEKKEIVKVIYDESLRMGRLVNELLDLARMEAGHISLFYEDIDIDEFIQRITRKFHGLAKERNISLSYEIKKSIGLFPLDSDRIEQVLTNLIDNAIRHTNELGKVIVCVAEHSNGLMFEIKDSGLGIPEHDLPFVFERFYKADKARTRGRAGTGLGLAIAKNIIDAHHGHLSVHSKLNEGTTFTFFLPRKNEQFEV